MKPAGWIGVSSRRIRTFCFFKGMIAFRNLILLCVEADSGARISPGTALAPRSIYRQSHAAWRFRWHGASQADNDIYVMINAYWEELRCQIQEVRPKIGSELWRPPAKSQRFLQCASPLQQSIYQVAPRSIVILVRGR